MNKGAPYKKTKLMQYECDECDNTYKLDEIDDHLRMHIEHDILKTTLNAQGGMARGVLGMLMRGGR
jgi:hypothetical protein